MPKATLLSDAADDDLTQIDTAHPFRYGEFEIESTYSEPVKLSADFPKLVCQLAPVNPFITPQLCRTLKSHKRAPPIAGLSDGHSHRTSGNNLGNIASDADRAKPVCTDVLSQVTTRQPYQQAE
jgi:hypothetical protein